MRRALWKRTVVACAAIIMTVTFVNANVNAGPAKAQPRVGERLFFTGEESLANLERAVVAQGIDGIAAKDKQVGAEGRLIWSKVSEQRDELGMRHVLYAQAVKLTGRGASLIEPEYVSKGVRVEGGDVGVHFQADGKPRAVLGRQHRDVELGNEPLIGNAKQAWEVAQGVAVGFSGFEPGDPAAWSTEQIESQIMQSRLSLVSQEGEAAFRFVWRVPTFNRDGDPHEILMDAATAEVLAVYSQTPADNCAPDTTNKTDASLVSQYSQTARSTQGSATLATTRGVLYDGRWPGTVGVTPTIEVYQGTMNSSLWCGPSSRWMPLPLGSKSYSNWTWNGTSIRGSAGADAAYFTNLTMKTLKNQFGRVGWDGSRNTAKIVVEAQDDYPDYVRFMLHGHEREFAPLNAVSISRQVGRPYSYSAAIDIVAHEWGHGVVHTSPAGLDYDDESRCSALPNAQFHEGFADVLAHSVEWFQQPTGTGQETRDWSFGEDNGAAQRVAGVDDGAGRLSLFNHKDDWDDPTCSEGAYARGNMLVTAFWLMSNGGYNPVCNRKSFQPACNTNVINIGTAKASRILMRALLWYSFNSMTWDDIRPMAMASAYDLYARCSPCSTWYDAILEQRSAHRAFVAIGYGGDELFEYCPCPH
jgi:Zn-dependent metalloprotease